MTCKHKDPKCRHSVNAKHPFVTERGRYRLLNDDDVLEATDETTRRSTLFRAVCDDPATPEGDDIEADGWERLFRRKIHGVSSSTLDIILEAYHNLPDKLWKETKEKPEFKLILKRHSFLTIANELVFRMMGMSVLRDYSDVWAGIHVDCGNCLLVVMVEHRELGHMI